MNPLSPDLQTISYAHCFVMQDVWIFAELMKFHKVSVLHCTVSLTGNPKILWQSILRYKIFTIRLNRRTVTLFLVQEEDALTVKIMAR